MKYSDIQLLRYGEMNALTFSELEGEPKSKKRKTRSYVVAYKPDETDFSHNGLGILNEALACYVVEELNGGYYLEMEYPKDNVNKYKHLQPLNILKAEGQLFRIPAQNSIQDKHLKIKINAPHIFYDLGNDFNEDVRADNKNVVDALSIALACNPKFHVGESDLTKLHNAYYISESPVTSIYNKILPRWGGELKRNNFEVSIVKRLGRETGFTIRYGKNIEGFEQVLDYSQLITRAYPVGKDGLRIGKINSNSNFIDSPRLKNYPLIFAKEVGFPDIDNVYELKAEAEKIWGTVDIPKTTYKVKFIDLLNAKEYELLGQMLSLKLGDTVAINHKIFNLNLNARVIKIKKNILTGNIEELELGQFLPTIASRLNNINNQISKVNNSVESSHTEIKNINDNYQSILAELALKQDEEQVNELIEGKLLNMTSNQKLSEEINSLESRINNKFKRTKLGVMV